MHIVNENLHDINDDLLVKFLTGEADAYEASKVESWLQQNAENKKYFDHFVLIWEESLRLSVKSNPDENDAWSRFLQLRKSNESKTGVRRFYFFNSWIRVAATLVLIASLGWLAHYVSSIRTSKPIETVNVATEKNVITDTLPDGSVATLNKHSVLSYPSAFKGNKREVTLSGEAFFTVKPDKTKLFIVHANDITVQVVGTSFNVRSENGKTEVIVETGVVIVSKKSERTPSEKRAVQLKPKQKIITQWKDSTMVKDSASDKLYNYYLSKEFICNNTPLKKLVETLNEAYDTNITIENKVIENLPITATFKNESLDHTLSIISETLGVTVEKENDKIILK